MLRLIETGVSQYRALSKLGWVSVGKNIAAIDAALKSVGKSVELLRRFTDPRGGIGQKTLHCLNPYASEALSGLHLFISRAEARKVGLRRLNRLGHEHGPLAILLCSWLGLLFDTVHKAKGGAGNKRQLRAIAIEVFQAANIRWEDYHDHPRRMDKLFRSVPDGLETEKLVKELFQDIQNLTG